MGPSSFYSQTSALDYLYEWHLYHIRYISSNIVCRWHDAYDYCWFTYPYGGWFTRNILWYFVWVIYIYLWLTANRLSLNFDKTEYDFSYFWMQNGRYFFKYKNWKSGVCTKFFSRLSEESFTWLIQKFPCRLLFKTGQPGPQLNLSEGQIRLDLTSGRPLV